VGGGDFLVNKWLMVNLTFRVLCSTSSFELD